MGRKPVPTALKLLHGNPGKRPLNDAEPRPRRVMPRCPEHLDDIARARWKQLAKELYNTHILTVIDRDTLAAYCQAYSRWAKAEENVRESGEVITTQSGNLIQNPYLGIANRAMDQMVKIGTEFGLTPSSRVRLKVTEPEPADELAAFLSGRKQSSGG